MLTKRFAIPFLLLSLVPLTGCSESDAPELVTVTGTVAQGGAPAEGVLVEFRSPNGRPSFGRTDEEGRYTAMYTPNTPGVLPGTIPVYVTVGEINVEPEFDANGDPIPPKGGMDGPAKAQRYPNDLMTQTGDGAVEFDLMLELLDEPSANG